MKASSLHFCFPILNGVLNSINSAAILLVENQQTSWCRAGNLGALSNIVEKQTAPDFVMPDLEAFEPGVHFDGLAVSGSLILLVVLLGIALERVLGLDRYFVGLVTKLKFEKLARERKQDVADRARLEKLFQDGEDFKKE